MNLMTTDPALTMSSRDIAELTDKRHDHVMRDIRNMLEELGGPKAGGITATTYTDGANREQPEYLLNKELTLTLVSGYSVKMRYAIIQRWQELEAQTGLPDFTNPIAAAQAWIESEKERQRLALEHAKAVRTKAEIGHRREATAMNTASQAVKRANRLEIELDQSKDYCTIKRMQMLCHGQQFSWRELKSASIEMNLAPVNVFDANYGNVKAYHRDVWREVYALAF